MFQNYYQPSGRVPVTGLLLTIIIGVVASIILSFVYVFLTDWIPFVYINFIIVAGFGGLLGVSIIGAGEYFKIRNKAVFLIVCVSVALFAYYLHWCFYLHTKLEMDTMLWFTNPSLVLAALIEVNEVGTFNIKGIDFSGIGLAVVWLIEAAIILGIPILIAFAHDIKPFSETANEWFKEKVLPAKVLAPANSETLRAQLENSNYEALLKLKPTDDAAKLFLTITAYEHDNEPECFITIQKTTVGVDKDGKPELNTKDLMKFIGVSKEALSQLERNLSGPVQESIKEEETVSIEN